ncbi:MAG TPA: type II toxin-antitoxin system RelE/ParE family toxin [Syntrophorhabdales bacterium]|nr:type II toxin-antitoxin system RelE/ParE family toxin [Syntrophorhabdales bacterium]
MKKSYDVRWSETAERDLIAIVEYIADDSPSRAYEVFKEVRRKASGLRTFPDRGRIVPELQEQGITQYHELVVSPWRIIYRTSERTVYVLAVLDSRRSMEDILLRRLTGLKL